MKKLLPLLLLCFVTTAQAADRVKVVTTLPVFASIAQEIGGERIDIDSLAPPNKDPHFLDAKPSYVVKLNRADVLIEGGMGLENGWLPPILMQARNAKVMPGRAGYVNLATGIAPLEIPTAAGRALGDVHPAGNPHTWLDPRNIKIMAVNIQKHLIEVDPAGRAHYQANLRAFLQRLNDKISDWEKRGRQLKGVAVLTYHKSLSYFSKWIGITIVDTIEPRPGIPPSSRRADKLLQKIPSWQIKAVIAEPFYPKKLPRYIAEKGGIPLLIVETDTGDQGIHNYFDLMDRLIDQLIQVL